jgi:hypothetical protein
LAEELIASALRNESAGTIVGTKDCDAGSWKARATPSTASTAKIGRGVATFQRAKASSTQAQIP